MLDKFVTCPGEQDTILLYKTGPSGNQSTRHFITANTFHEAQRLGNMLGERIVEAIEQLTDADYKDSVRLSSQHTCLMLPKKKFMSLHDAEEKEKLARSKLAELRGSKADMSEIRTAEVDLFGAEENKQLAGMAANGELDEVYESVLPAEITLIGIGDSRFVFLPGELFVEYSLIIKKHASQRTYVVSLANGTLAGYIVTEEAEQEGGYEASNSIFPAEAGRIIVNEVLAMIQKRG